MIRVMLVEDEPAVLNGLIKTMSFLEMAKIVATAYNGQEALEALEACRPDLIITDIKMPIMTGLELIRQVNIKYPDTICVLLSGYSEFEYAREALRLKVFDYMLKPVPIEKLTEVLQLVEKTVYEKTKGNARETIQKLVNSTENLISPVCLFPKQYSYYYLVHICAGPISIPSLDLIFPDLDYWTEESILNHILDLFDNQQAFVVPGKISNEKWMLCGFNTQTIELVQNIMRRLMAHFSALNYPVTLSLSEPFNDLQSISHHARKIREYAYKNIVIGKARILLNSEQDQKSEHVILSQQEELFLKMAAEKNAYSSVCETMKDIFDKWKENVVTENMCDYSIKHIFSILMNDKDTQTNQQAVNDLFFEIDVVVSSAGNYQEMYEGIEQLIKSFLFDVRDSNSALNIQQNIDKIESYILNHYAEPISSENLSEIFGYNPIYLTSTFCCIKGISPNKLIKKVRVEKAKALLLEHPNMLLKEIAQVVGYDDALYFSRVFKSMTDLNPSEYRKSQGI